jgi:hypothetical protein
MDCGRIYAIEEYIEEMDTAMWEQISTRPCNRA